MEQPLISVGILQGEKVKFELYGEFYINNTNQSIKGKFEASIQNKVIVIESENTMLTSPDEIIFTPKDFNQNSFVLRDVVIGIGFHWEEKEKQSFQRSQQSNRST